jgi:hypothetical protein
MPLSFVRWLVWFRLAFVAMAWTLGAAWANDLPPGPSAGVDLVAPAFQGTVAVPDGWATVEGQYLRIHAAPRHKGVQQALLEHSDPRVPALSERLGLPAGGAIDVFIASTDAEFRAIQPSDPPTWADATAYPSFGAVFLRAPLARRGDREPLTTVLDHEIVHIVVGRAFAPRRPPTWLQEGLAQLHAEQHDFAKIRQLGGATFGGALPLERLERGFPANPHAATLAYAQSVDFLVWLEREEGPGTVAALVEELRVGNDLPGAVLAVTGLPLHEVDRRWSSRFRGWSGFVLTTVGSMDFLWLVVSLLGLVTVIVVRRRQRRRRRVIRSRESGDQERLDDLARRLASRDIPHRLPWRDAEG